MTAKTFPSVPWWSTTPTVASPERAALIDPDGRVLSRQLVVDAVRAVAGTLGAQGVTRQDRLALVMAPGVESAATLLGAMATTAVVPLSASSPATVLTETFRRLGVSGVLVGDDSPEAVTQAADRLGVPVVHVDPFRLDAADRHVPAVPDPNDLALVLQTSGTTAHPKAVPLTHGNLQASTQWLAGSLGLRADDRGLLVMPLFHISGIVASLLAPLAAGGSVICCRGTDPRELFEAVADRCPTWLSASPAFFHALLAEVDSRGGDPAARALRFLRTAGSPLDRKLAADLREVFGVPVLESYGMTEVAGVDLYAIRGGEPEGSPEVAVLDAHGRRRPEGTPGEIAVRGDNVTRGYEGAERSGWIEAADGRRWFLTGDEGYLDAGGRLVLSGRIKEIINRGGEKVSPRRVEEALHAHPNVKHAVAFPIPHPTLGEDVAAAVVPVDESAVGEDELRRYAADLLPPYEVPSRIVILSELPRTALGKLRRADMADLLADDLAGGATQPQGELETLIADTFAEVLNQDRPSRDANFLMLGGDSLSGQRVISRLGSAVGRALSPALLFEHPTVRGLAERLADCPATADGQSGRIPVAQGHDADFPLRGKAFPASPAQARMWFLHQLAPDLTAYHMPSMWRLRGVLDVEALREALSAVIERHPTLRTAFAMRAGEVQQIVVEPVTVPLEVEQLDGRAVDSVLADWMQRENSRAFDLASGLLLRARLLQVSADEHVLLLNHHHISSDGWSLSLLFRDLTALYNAAVGGLPSPLPPLRVHYHDYAEWQREALSDVQVRELLDYWIPDLDGVPALQLPADHPRPPRPSHRGGRVAFDIEDIGGFENLCRSEGATLHMGLVALAGVLLGRYSRQTDFAIGIPHWGRSHPDVEDLVGLFLNTLAIRVRLDGIPTFRQVLRQVRQTSIAAYEHHELPFDRIVDVIAPQRDTSRNPLIQVMVQLVELRAPSLDGLVGIEAEPEPDRHDSVRLDLEFIARRTADGGLGVTVFFAKDLFDRARIERLTTHFRTLVEAAVQSPDAPAESLNMLPDRERAMIECWRSGLTAEIPDVGVHQMVERQALRTPDAVALIAGDDEVSYADLNARANRLAGVLANRGLGAETLVAVCLARSAEWVVALLAIFKAGAAYLPLDPTLPQARVDQIIDIGKPAVLLTDRESASRFASGSIPVVDVSARIDSSPALETTGAPYTPERLAYVLFTSGSTGVPKGVEVEHRTLANLVHWHAAHPRLWRPARTLQFASCGFDVSLQEVFSTLAVGGCLVLVDRETQRDSRLLLAALTEHRVERIFLPYVALEQLAVTAVQSAIPQSLRDVVSAGEQLSLTPPLRKLFAALPDCRLHNHYGPTETHVVTADQLSPLVDAWPEEAGIGTPVDNAEIRILETSGQRCPIGIPGELWIGGRSVARGYLDNPERTAAKFTANLTDAEGRFYRSGDLACWNPDGTISFHGRADDQIKVRGFRVEPEEVAAALLGCSGVAQAAVASVRNESGSDYLVAYLVPESGCAIADPGHLRTFLNQRLPDYMIPAAFVELARLPLNQNGKLDRTALPAPSFSGRGTRVNPSSSVELALSSWWTDALGHGDFGVTDNFFLVGGQSLAAVRLAAAIETGFGEKVSVLDIFRRPTIAEQASWVTRRPGGREEGDTVIGNPSGNVITLQPHGDLPALYAVHGYRGSVSLSHLAPAMGSRRPFLGLQASGVDHDAALPSPSVEAIAARYADQIMARTPAGTAIHLVGYSAGGWYAYAVADALLQRGAQIGLLAVLDTGGTARIHRRIGLVTLPLRLIPRIGVTLRDVLAPPAGQRRIDYLRDRFHALNRHVDSFLFHHRSVDDGLRKAVTTAPDDVDLDSDFYLVVHRGYRPARLPIAVDVFTPPGRVRFMRPLWSFYARGGVRVHRMFSDHTDFLLTGNADTLAAALTSALADVEAGT